MERITQKDLEYLVDRINEVTNSPKEQYTKTVTKSTKTRSGQVTKFTGNIDNYYLDYAYGGVKLVQMVNEGGGIREISRGGFGTKRELYNWMGAFLAGIGKSYCKSCHEEIEQRILVMKSK